MQVSIIIPNYNGLKYLRNCLDSLFRQTFRSYEVIIVDNCSTDESCNYIVSNYPNISLIKLDKNYGFSKAVNEGIKVAKGKYIVLLNNDTEVEKDWLQNLICCIEKDSNIFSCCSKMLRYEDRKIIDDAGDEYTILGWADKRGDGFPSDRYNISEEVFSSCAGAAIYRKKILDKIGFFDENFFAYMEDVDISYRAKIYGYKNMYCSDAIVYHIGSATSGSKYNSFKVSLAARNNVYVVYKNMPIIQLLLNLPFITIGHLIKFIFFIFKGFGKDYLIGLKEGIITLRYISKIKYNKQYFINYVKIEKDIIRNTFRYFVYKLSKK